MIFVSESVLGSIKNTGQMGFFSVLASSGNENELLTCANVLKITPECIKQHGKAKFFVIGQRKVSKAIKNGAKRVHLSSLFEKCSFRDTSNFIELYLRQVEEC